MIKAIEKKFEVLEIQLEQLLEETATLSPDQFHFQPAADSWSISQVFQHLIKAEAATNTYIRKKILAGKSLKKSGIKAQVTSGLLRAVMRSPFKFKAPNQVKIESGTQKHFTDQASEWRHQRGEMRAFLEDLDGQASQKLIFKHPSGIRMNAAQMVMWTGAHIGRHLKQIKRIRKNTGFPEGEKQA
jgi:hypothetical protein